MKKQSSFVIDDKWSAADAEMLSAALHFVRHSSDSTKAVEMAAILDELKVDAESIVAAMLYAVTDYEKEVSQLSQLQFPLAVKNLANEVHTLLAEESGWVAQLEAQPQRTRQRTEAHHMMLLSMMQDVRAVFILLAHQLWQMRNIKDASEEHRKAVAWETRAIFAPLANRLGIGHLKWELEDLAFRYLEPDSYKMIAQALEERRTDREVFIETMVAEVSGLLETAGISAKVYGRPKHLFSIWRKMQLKHLEFDELYDVRALRVMVDSVRDCYAALSEVHARWSYIPGEYDDYIAAPKSNNYQSLHTAVLGEGGKSVEIQFRTWDMHEHAELGVAAHWRYKEGGGKRDEGVEKRVESLRQALEAVKQDESLNPAELEKSAGNIYVLTPKGSVVELGAGATPLDFAYHVHTEVGHRCRGAKVNGQMVPLTTRLKSGQHVEIITVKEGAPSRDWLTRSAGYLATSRARAKVKAWFKAQFREQDIAVGKLAVSKESAKRGLQSIDLSPCLSRFNFSHEDDLLAAIGRGEIGVAQVFNLLVEPQKEEPEFPEITEPKSSPALSKGEVDVSGVGNLMTQFARCCKPMSGDDIVGFITRGRGVSIHRATCSNAVEMMQQHPDRFIEVKWSNAERTHYEVDIEVLALDRSGLLRDVSSVLAAEDVNVLAANTRSDKRSQEARMRLTLELADAGALDKTLKKLGQLRSVLSVYRVK